jgi:hypothetical protein
VAADSLCRDESNGVRRGSKLAFYFPPVSRLRLDDPLLGPSHPPTHAPAQPWNVAQAGVQSRISNMTREDY